MNPIPLSAPDGQIYAYACSHCRHVGGGASLICPPESDGPHEQLVMASLRDARSCCICRTCKAIIPLDTWGGIECESCRAWWQFCTEWIVIANAIKDGLTEAQWRSRIRDDELEIDDDE